MSITPRMAKSIVAGIDEIKKNHEALMKSTDERFDRIFAILDKIENHMTPAKTKKTEK